MDIDVSDPEAALKKLVNHGYKMSTIGTYLSALINLVRTKPSEKDLLRAYQKQLKSVLTNVQAAATHLTDAQAKANRPWSEIEAVRDGLEGKDDFDYTVMCLYTMIAPLRDDFRDVEFTSKRKGNPTAKNHYYLSEDGKADELILNQYKTSKSYGQQRREIPERLAAIVRSYRAKTNSPYLLPRKTDPSEPAGDDVRHALRRILGPGGGSSLLRKIGVSAWTEGGNGDIDKLAKNMCHSIGIQQKSYNLVKSKGGNNTLGIALT